MSLTPCNGFNAKGCVSNPPNLIDPALRPVCGECWRQKRMEDRRAHC